MQQTTQRRSKKDKIFIQVQSQLADKDAAWAKKKKEGGQVDDEVGILKKN